MENVERWINQSPMSDTGPHGAAVAELPEGISDLTRVVQGLIIHTDWLGAYGVDVSQFAGQSRETLPVAERLVLALKREPRALGISRSPELRTLGTCRDFALTLCAFLRSKGIAARVRCGFAEYLGDGWEDHWVCEYFDRESQSWRLSDAQLDEVLREKRDITFDPTDTPRHAFMRAGQAWAACRNGSCDPDRFGHGKTTGWWFMKVDVVRDHFAINNRETSAWDSWRAAPELRRVVSDRDWVLLDDLAARPEQPILSVDPDWR